MGRAELGEGGTADHMVLTVGKQKEMSAAPHSVFIQCRTPVQGMDSFTIVPKV